MGFCYNVWLIDPGHWCVDFHAQCRMNQSGQTKGATYIERVEAKADAVLVEGPPGPWDPGHEKGQCCILSHYGWRTTEEKRSPQQPEGDP